MSLTGTVKGVLKRGERVGGCKKRVHFSDEGPVNLEDTSRATAALDHGHDHAGVATTDAAKPCWFKEKEPGLVEVFAKASIICGKNLHTMAGVRQMGGNAEGKSCLIEEENWSSFAEAGGKDGDMKESISPSTPPSCVSYGLAMRNSHKSAGHGKMQTKGVQRKLTFVDKAGDHQTSRNYGFTNKKAQSKVQNYRVVPENEGGFSTDYLPIHHVNGTHTFAFEDGACKKRCAWITPHSDAVYVAYHDEEWGVPVHEDRRLFELLVFAGAQSEIAWSSILIKREAYRDSFAQFDPAILATYDTAKMMHIKSQRDIMKSEARVESIINNAKVVMKIVEEFGSFSDYLWGFVSYKPIVSKYKQAKSIPMRTAKSEAISKDLQRRGMRHAGPMVLYSFMQAAGLASDHLISCFCHPSISTTSSPSSHPPPPLPPTKSLVSPLCY